MKVSYIELSQHPHTLYLAMHKMEETQFTLLVKNNYDRMNCPWNLLATRCMFLDGAAWCKRSLICDQTIGDIIIFLLLIGWVEGVAQFTPLFPTLACHSPCVYFFFPFYLTRVALQYRVLFFQGALSIQIEIQGIGFTKTSINTHTSKQYKYIDIKRMSTNTYNNRYQKK